MNDDKKSETKYVMVESDPSVEEDEIDLLELIRTLLQSWKLIVCITIFSTGAFEATFFSSLKQGITIDNCIIKFCEMGDSTIY